MLIIISALFVVITVLFALEASSVGAKMIILENKEDLLLQENKELLDKMVSETSLSIISEKSQEMGFIKPTEIVYTSKDIGVVANLR